MQISQKAGQVIWYSHFLRIFHGWLIVIHTVSGFGIANKSEVDVFLELLTFLMIQWMLAI